MAGALRPVTGLLAGGLALAFFLPLALGLLATAMFLPGAELAQIVSPRWLGALELTLLSGWGATLLSLMLALCVVTLLERSEASRRLQTLLPPILAVPHAALAVGLVFLLAPSGWLVRLASPELTGFERPPRFTVPDAQGWTLLLGLALKEFPFLVWVSLAALPRLQPELLRKQAASLGYGRAQFTFYILWPQLLRLIRLPVAVVLAYNLSVVDMALILGPGQPPTLAALVLEFFTQPGGRATASLGAWWLLAVVVLSMVVGRWAYVGLIRWMTPTRVLVRRPRQLVLASAKGVVMAAWLLVAASLVTLLIWSLAERWRFPAPLPTDWTLRFWFERADLLGELVGHTLILAFFTTAAALAAAVAWLELERHGRVPRADWVWYIPLLLPQVLVLVGWQAGALFTGADGRAWVVIWGHWMYAMPYVVLVLAEPWRNLNPNFEKQARVQGLGYWTQLRRVRVPLLLRPLCAAGAIAVAVSVAQYLPTLLLSGGRIPTLTTELVTAFGGVDRRVVGALASLQMLLPLLAFAVALAWPAIRFRRFSGA